MLFVIVDKNTLQINKMTRDEYEVYDASLYEKIQVDEYDTISNIKFVRELGKIVKKELTIYALVDRKTLKIIEFINENEYKSHDDNVVKRVSFSISEIKRLGMKSLKFNPDFTYYSDLSEHESFDRIRMKRNLLISETDWMVSVDSPLSDDKLHLIKTYRQKLRDITSNIHPDDVIFPEKPFKF